MKTSRGMSLIECLVWIAVFTFVMVGLSQMIIYFYRTSNYTLQEASAVSSAQHGIDIMVRQIREASYSSNGAYPVISISTSSMSFYAEVDGDSGIELVHYYVSGIGLYQGTINPVGDPSVYTGAEATTSISDYVHNIDKNIRTFTYFNASGAQISDFTRIGDVRFVTVNLAIDVDPNRTPTILTMRSSAALRNLVGH